VPLSFQLKGTGLLTRITFAQEGMFHAKPADIQKVERIVTTGAGPPKSRETMWGRYACEPGLGALRKKFSRKISAVLSRFGWRPKRNLVYFFGCIYSPYKDVKTKNCYNQYTVMKYFDLLRREMHYASP
jgi:hypothetical protein